MVTMQDIERISRRIADEFRPERIVLFGSYASGSARDESDVDLLVIMPFDGKPLHQSFAILDRVDPPFAVDLLARRPEDIARRYAEGDPLIRDALDRGKVLYQLDMTSGR